MLILALFTNTVLHITRCMPLRASLRYQPIIVFRHHIYILPAEALLASVRIALKEMCDSQLLVGRSEHPSRWWPMMDDDVIHSSLTWLYINYPVSQYCIISSLVPLFGILFLSFPLLGQPVLQPWTGNHWVWSLFQESATDCKFLEVLYTVTVTIEVSCNIVVQSWYCVMESSHSL